MKSVNWTSYGSWRSKIYPSPDLFLQTRYLRYYYQLPDLKLIAFNMTAYAGVESIECEYPGFVNEI